MHLKSFITKYFWGAVLLLVFVWFNFGQSSTQGRDAPWTLENPVQATKTVFEAPNSWKGVREPTARISSQNPEHSALFVVPEVAAAQSLPETSWMLMGTVGLMLLMVRAGRALRQGRSVQLR
jgi:hypothetical protein